VIVVLFNGRPLALTRLQEKAMAILEAWHPGVQGGHAIADILFGDADPAGRLTTSFPRSVGQVPVYYNHFNTGRPLLGKYVDGPREPLYPFGFGLTYTVFEYGKVQLNGTTMKAGGTLSARIRVTNVGPRAGSEVVQLYLNAPASSIGPRPVRELKGFQKVRWVVEPGKFLLWLTKDSASGDPVGFEFAPSAKGAATTQ
jgi:beta-glucosidase